MLREIIITFVFLIFVVFYILSINFISSIPAVYTYNNTYNLTKLREYNLSEFPEFEGVDINNDTQLIEILDKVLKDESGVVGDEVRTQTRTGVSFNVAIGVNRSRWYGTIREIPGESSDLYLFTKDPENPEDKYIKMPLMINGINYGNYHKAFFSIILLVYIFLMALSIVSKMNKRRVKNEKMVENPYFDTGYSNDSSNI